MKHLKSILKISIIFLLLVVCVGSIHAADDSSADLVVSSSDDDFDLDDDEELDDDDEWADDEEEDDGDEWGDDEELDDDEWDDDEEDDDLDDYNETEDDYTDFDYLKFKIVFYLDRYGNYSSHNWTESDEFLSEYQIYLLNSSDYKLNESAEGYETYLKIFDSITSTFGDYNLTENETDYLKFMVIFYLNHYGNVSANYTWNESESFANFTPPIYYLTARATGAASFPSSDESLLATGYSPFYTPLANTNSTDVNQTATSANQTSVEVQNSWDFNIFILILMLLLMIVIVI